MYATVVIDAVLSSGDKIFDYIIPQNLSIEVGSRVLVPFGARMVEGFVLGICDTSTIEKSKLKKISRALDDFVAIKPEFLQYIDEICGMCKIRKIDALRLFVPSVLRGGRASTRMNLFIVCNFDADTVRASIDQIPPRARAQRAFLETFIGSPVQKLTDVLKRTSAQTIDALIMRGFLKKEARAVARVPSSLDALPHKKIVHTDEQRAVLAEIEANTSRSYLLHGVTGSGKTEVYMSVIERELARGRSAIILVPEIGLTPQALAVFRARFGDTVAVLHSGLSNGERYDEWLRLHMGEARIAIGARSAVFAPVENLGVVIIDEEHDGSYFAESNPRFHTHDIASLRCRANKATLVLGSATPSIETYYKARTGEYKLLTLSKRVSDLAMPTIELVDMCAELRSGNGGIFSSSFLLHLEETIKRKQQAMIFINRRGYTSHVMCKSCGYTAKCENCDVALVYHKHDNLLKCHYCGARFTPFTKCPKCSSTYLKNGATGTQKLVEELKRAFPDVPVFRMDTDNTRTKDALIDILNNFASTSPSILVGTQMIAKGHHFPRVSLVGIIDADNSLHFSDYRASERTFALITQVAGRAGRAQMTDGEAGHVVLQTYVPRHYVYGLAKQYDYLKFFEKELNIREVTKYPPFATIVRVLFSAEVDAPIKVLIEKIMKKLRERNEEFIYLGAMKSPLGRIQNKFRYQILARFHRQKEKEMLDFISDAVASEPPRASVAVFLEINPQNLS